MINFVPLSYYTPLYYHTILFVIVITWVHTQSFSGFSKDTHDFNRKVGWALFWFVLLYMGLRPISYVFGDMGNYATVFRIYASGGYPGITQDIGFYTMMKLVSYFKSPGLFFFVVSALYVLPVYIAAKRWFPNYYYFAFLILIASFSFWTFGTNGLRNGVATSLMLLAFSYYDKKLVMYMLFLLAYSFHSSMLLPIIAYFITIFVRNPRVYFFGWFISIILSIFMGTFWEGFFIRLGFGQEDKLQTYFGEKEEYIEQFAYAGFRWDFLVYSGLAVLISYYFIFVKRINDKHYIQLTNIYLLANAFWILVIRASFSNRFAYLSWFMMGIIIIYPFLKKVYWRNQFSIIGFITILYFSFTYFMNVILG